MVEGTQQPLRSCPLLSSTSVTFTYSCGSSNGVPAGLTAEKAAFVEELAIALHLLGVVNGPLAHSTFVAATPVRHCRFFFFFVPKERRVPLVIAVGHEFLYLLL